ncbi:PREDICTED: multiple C2 and transmembrane domain-containing protein 1 [Thamnophis sirtalis]|uniref:Multiple C2 and transmembrane domain-containing protein 1 n=1 Tax=Thamnophis sirtalis TaxID=35019 RepID=A0A6I9YPU6_9SAUR|nr:PREDICTED: multiple C2 and transmembrane domain-containing protein 1 [Thamnophis sirtalis]
MAAAEEPGAAPATGSSKAGEGEPASSFQSRLWRSLQLGGKGKGSSKAGAERRSADTSPSLPRSRAAEQPAKADLLAGGVVVGSRWGGLRRRKHVLDRVFSSSQPNLCCSSAEPLEGVSAEAGSALRRLREHLLHHPQGKGGQQHGRGADDPPASPSSTSSAAAPEKERVVGGDGALKAEAREKPPQPPRLGAHLSHQKSSSLPGNTTCLEQLLEDAPAKGKAKGPEGSSSPSGSPRSSKLLQRFGTSNVELPPAEPGMYQLDITLRRGTNLAARDRRGTSDPYVKFKLGGKEIFRSKTISKNLNPVWEERTSILIEHLREQLYIKVFDYDFGLQDDFMGSAFLDLNSLEQNRPIDVTLSLKDSHYPDQDLGTILLTVLLTPKEQQREGTMLMRKSWKRTSKFQTQSIRLSDFHKKAQLWRGIVSITLIEGRGLKAMDSNGLSDPYVKFRLGHQKYKSKIMSKTLNPRWREQFDLHLYEERGGIIDITVWDRDAGKKDDFIGRCQIDLSTLSKEHTHKLELPLEEGEGHLILLVTLTASAAVTISDFSMNVLEDPKEQKEILKRYNLMQMFQNIKDVGFLQVKVIRAEGLMAADVTGKNYFHFYANHNIKDIHSVLEVTVYDEDRDRSADFLGKVVIPLLYIQNGEQKAYVLKNKQLTGPTKGVIYLEMDVIFNAVKASIQTLMPKEQKYIEEENRLSKQLLLRNFMRVKHCIMVIINAAYFINGCFEWESPPRSLAAFVLFLIVTWNFELYMIPLILLLLLVWNYLLVISGKDNRPHDTVVEDMLEDEEEEDDRDDKDSEKKGFINKLYAIQEVCISFQNILDEVASLGERIKNIINWTIPFLSWLAIVALCVFTVILYFIPLRYIVLVWGINKFTKKLRSPYAIDNNELLDFLSRVPSDVQMVQYQELKQELSHSPSKRKKNNLS